MAEIFAQPRFGFSHYYNHDDWVHRFDPRTRLITLLLWLGVITATARLPGLGMSLVLVLSLLIYSGIPIKKVLQRMVRPLIFIIVLAVIQVLFSPIDPTLPYIYQWGVIRINSVGLQSGAKLLLRFSSLFLLLNWLTVVLSPTDIIRALTKLLHPLEGIKIPTHDLVLLIQVALHFLPLLSSELDRIVKAQASRGAEWGLKKGRILQRARQTFPILIPLFVTSLRRAENLAQAIEARGYGTGPRTTMVVLNYTFRDAGAGLLVVLMSVLIVIL